MTNSTTNVVVAKPLVSGGILVAPLGTALPTDEITTLNVAFLSPGYVGDDGVDRGEKLESGQIFAWGGALIAGTQKSKLVTAKFMLVEYLNPVTQKLIYGDANVTTTEATVSAGNKLKIAGSATAVPPHKSWVIEMFAGLARGRLVFPDANISDLDDVSYKDDDVSARGCTIQAFPDSAGNCFYEYWDDGQHSAS